MSFSLDFDSLPTLPVIVQQVMTEINNTQSSIKDIASIVERDQSMSTKILKLVKPDPIKSEKEEIHLLAL